MEVGKHAYLIMAHNEPELLMKLISALDHSRNDIFLHIDKKSDCFDLKALSLLPKKSKITILPSMNVNWGGDSQIRCEMALLKEAARENYQFYHLLSGVDFPLKSQSYIHAFFDKNPNKSFIHLDSVQQTPEVLDRVRYYWLFQNQIGRNKGKLPALCYYIQRFLIKVQKSFDFDRLRYIYIYKGANWFSISDQMAQYIVQNERRIRRFVRSTLCADEVFLQTFALNSNLKDTVITDNLRLIDWKRGSPYTFQDEDFWELCQSEKLFARKFSLGNSSDIVNRLMEYWTEK